jgi:hypothetical protein
MRRAIIPLLLIVFSLSVSSCGNSRSKISDSKSDIGKITQQEDGTISLDLEKASTYNCTNDPSCSTAEWDFVVSKPGRYNVWLSSATTDTMNLQYKTSVKINLLDEMLEAKPVGDKIVLDTDDVKYPWYRADSYMGSVIIQQPGEYSIQVINEKVVEEKSKPEPASFGADTRMMSVILTPMTR